MKKFLILIFCFFINGCSTTGEGASGGGGSSGSDSGAAILGAAVVMGVMYPAFSRWVDCSRQAPDLRW